MRDPYKAFADATRPWYQRRPRHESWDAAKWRVVLYYAMSAGMFGLLWWLNQL